LAGRYRFNRVLGDRTWLADDLRTGRQVVASVVSKRDAERFTKLKGIEDRHLARILLVQQGLPSDERPPAIPEGEAVVAAELVRGKSLAALLGDRTAMPPARAVAWTLRLARSLHRLRELDTAHGAISPAAIIVSGPAHPVAPVLTFFRAPTLGLALSPEVLSGAEATPADDVWSLGISLYAALTGHYPFNGATADEVQQAIKGGPKPLGEHGLEEPVLQRVVDELLAADPARRLRSVAELTATLDAYELETQLPAHLSSKGGVPRPPARTALPRPAIKSGSTLSGVVFDPRAAETPEVAEALAALREPEDSSAPEAPRPSSPDSPGRLSEGRTSKPISLTPPANHPFKKKGVAWPLVMALGAAGIAAYYFLLGPGAPVPQAAAPEPSVVATAAAPRKPTPATRKLNKAEKLDACVRSFFEDDQFAADADFSFVCQEGPMDGPSRQLHELAASKTDARIAAETAAASGAATAAATAAPSKEADVVRAGRTRRPLGWYELLASAIVRRSCCQPPPPVDLPKTPGWCDQLDDVVDNLAEDSARSGDLAPRVKRFDRAVDCLYANRVQAPYPDFAPRPLDEAQRTALQRFLAHAAVSEAKRRMLE
jgi:serine/threonine protein kinase